MAPRRSQIECLTEEDQHYQIKFHESLAEVPPRVTASFVQHFSSSSGPPQVLLICFLLALASGCTVGVIPAVVTDRLARINHAYTGADCFTFSTSDKPQPCRLGSQDAQNFSAVSSFISNTLTFITCALIGSFSDQYGRRGIIVLGMFLSLLQPIFLVYMQIDANFNPIWYYMVTPITGLVSWFAVALSSLSDVMPPKWRAPSFGILLASFMLGFAFSPLLAVTFDHWTISVISLSMHVCVFAFAFFFLPETLPLSARREFSLEEPTNPNIQQKISSLLLAPLRELSILNRNGLFRLLSALAFFSGMVSAADQSLLLYYAEDQFSFNDGDVATMFVIMGTLGIVVQATIMKPLNDCIGERRVVMVAFAFGAIHNIIYGLATSKRGIFIGVALGSFVAMSFPTISAIKSNNVREFEQGRVQGALYSLSALAGAVGPASLRIVYHATSKTNFPGSMFIFASFLYVFAVLCAYALPHDVGGTTSSLTNTKKKSSIVVLQNTDSGSTYGSLETMQEPLLAECTTRRPSEQQHFET